MGLLASLNEALGAVLLFKNIIVYNCGYVFINGKPEADLSVPCTNVTIVLTWVPRSVMSSASEIKDQYMSTNAKMEKFLMRHQLEIWTQDSDLICNMVT